MEFSVNTKPYLKLFITSAGSEKSVPTEKIFQKCDTVKDVKRTLEMVTAASLHTMTVKVYDSEDQIVCQLNDDNALLGSFHIDDGMRLHVEDKFILRKALEDDSKVEKFELSPHEYDKRDDSNNNTRGEGSVPNQLMVRGHHHRRDIEKLNEIKIQSLRRPQGSISLVCDESAGLVAYKENHTEADKLSDRLSKVSICQQSSSNNNNYIRKKFIPDVKSSLSPYAAEFVPQSCKQTSVRIINPDINEEISFFDNISISEHTGLFNFGVIESIQGVSEMALMNEKQNPTEIRFEQEVEDVMNFIEQQLVVHPGSFATLMTASTELFLRWSKFDETLEVLAKKLMDLSVKVNNFAYFGAKICTILDKIKREVGSFRSVILLLCQKTFESLEDTLSRENVQYPYGLVFFLAELYIQMDVKGTRIKSLGEGLLDILIKLILNSRSSDIYCVCKVLKLTGYALDEDHRAFLREVMDQLEKVNRTKFDAQTGSMLVSVLDLSKSNWGNNQSNVCSAEPSFTRGKGPEMYGPDGTVITAEEKQFLADNSMSQVDGEEEIDDLQDYDDDGMDEEMQEAFEQFLMSVPEAR